jgi:hypothetical protein
VVSRRRAPHLVPADACGHVLVEGGDFAVSPVLVKDVEPQRVTVDPEIVERGHRVRVVTRAAHHAAEFVADLLDDEELFRRTDTKSEPHADDVFLCQLRREFAGTGGRPFGSTDTMAGIGSGPRGSLISTRVKVAPPGAPLVPVTIRRS